jgi:ribosome-associated translation inhibitor RaiA
MRKQEKINKLERMGYKIQLSIPTSNVVVSKASRHWIFNSINHAYNQLTKQL